MQQGNSATLETGAARGYSAPTDTQQSRAQDVWDAQRGPRQTETTAANRMPADGAANREPAWLKTLKAQPEAAAEHAAVLARQQAQAAKATTPKPKTQKRTEA